jgi:hypothetical protein
VCPSTRKGLRLLVANHESILGGLKFHVRTMLIAQIRSCIRPSLSRSSQGPTNVMILDAWNVLAYGIRAATLSTDCGGGVVEQVPEQNAVVRGH